MKYGYRHKMIVTFFLVLQANTQNVYPTAYDIARWYDVTPVTARKYLRKLESAGYINLLTDFSDKRQRPRQQAIATESGINIMAKWQDVFLRWQESKIDALTWGSI